MFEPTHVLTISEISSPVKVFRKPDIRGRYRLEIWSEESWYAADSPYMILHFNASGEKVSGSVKLNALERAELSKNNLRRIELVKI